MRVGVQILSYVFVFSCQAETAHCKSSKRDIYELGEDSDLEKSSLVP